MLYKISFWLPYSHDKDDNINNNDKNEDDDDDDEDDNKQKKKQQQHTTHNMASTWTSFIHNVFFGCRFVGSVQICWLC